MKTIENQIFDEERALYGEKEILAVGCSFDGPADGESAFKEGADIEVRNCFFNLRYPFWHDHGLVIRGSEMTEFCRAALWYSEQIEITDSRLHGIKALRECSQVTVRDCDIISPEFGWSVRGITMEHCTAESEYFMMRSSDLNFKDVTFKGKYSFQYIENAVFENCRFDTKDAFWHAKNVVVRNSVVKGEYLAWYCENVTFENCTIIGTQPLCYCRGLRLIDCRMEGTDLAFEKSDVEAVILTPVISIKNPRSGHITLPCSEEIIRSDKESKCEIIYKQSAEQKGQNAFYVTVGNSVFSGIFAENSGAKALKEMLEDGPITVDMRDYGGFEKVGSLDRSLPASDTRITTKAGDIVLYQGNQIVIFYGSNSWSYTRLGKIDDLSGWEEALGNGNISAVFSLEES